MACSVFFYGTKTHFLLYTVLGFTIDMKQETTDLSGQAFVLIMSGKKSSGIIGDIFEQFSQRIYWW